MGDHAVMATSIGIFTPASPIGRIELEMGVEVLEAAGFGVTVHDQALAQHFIYAGTDEQRAGALWDLATDPAIDVLWCSRGGYGCTRLLPLLDRLTQQHGPPPRKLLVGYSDVTVLHHYARTRWGWDTLHANMPATASFVTMPNDQRDATFALVRDPGSSVDLFGDATLEFFTDPPTNDIHAPVLGGNLATWNYLTGTAYAPTPDDVAGSMLLFEDIGEGFHKIDAYFTQLDQARGLDGVKALILGGFHDCEDSASTKFKTRPTSNHPEPDKEPVRPQFDERESLAGITAALGKKHGFPVAWKLPVTHGPDYWPLPLGANYTLTPGGALRLNH